MGTVKGTHLNTRNNRNVLSGFNSFRDPTDLVVIRDRNPDTQHFSPFEERVDGHAGI
jgi:hypothetical protein